MLFALFPLACALYVGRIAFFLRRFLRHAAVQFAPDCFRYWDDRGMLHEIPWASIEQLIEQGRKHLRIDYQSEGEAGRLTLPFLSFWDRGAFPNRREFFLVETYAGRGGLPDRIMTQICTRAGLTLKRKAALVPESWIHGLWVPGRWARIIYSKPYPHEGTGAAE